MELLKFVKKTLSHFQRAQRKKEIIQRILEQPNQENNDIVNLHRLDYKNVGDLYCAPHHYFDELKGKELDIFDYKREEETKRENWYRQICANGLIIGGGGLLNRPGFKMQLEMIEKLSKTKKKIVFWGVGHNIKKSKYYGTDITYNVDSANYKLFGVRDFGRKEEWVPCVSCLHPIFDENYEVTRDIGIIFHRNTLKNKKVMSLFSDFDQTANNTDLQEMISFIGTSETVLTDSYHAMYWALLMEKKVVVFPNSSKFYDFKYAPEISQYSNYKSAIKKAQSYTGILEECRTINMNFSERVFDYLGK